eukprot:NODE_2485_length_2204_cov_3.917188.p1 GENE.NODE_2485_length_2204_cov_3.917188~~NODE_2485_length_2204_cov_3.917188.p1  ORF type:complete len:300 (+),score=96.23 NODE_2485_length_2204_cov_3.917188:934-1833(+)
MPVTSLPVLLDALSQLHVTSSRGDAQLSEDRRGLFAIIATRLTRQLVQLRPQDAARALNALSRVGVFAPHLVTGIAQLVPSRLATWRPEEVLELLEAYAAGRNNDGFMVLCLRRALMPTSALVPSLVDPAPLARLDDVALVRTAQAFAVLSCTDGLLSVVAVVGQAGGNASRRLEPSCSLALAALVTSTMPSVAHWEEAVQRFAAIEAAAADRAQQLLTRELYEEVRERGEAAAADADALLLASCAFSSHPRLLEWGRLLAERVGDCSAELLPALLLNGSDGRRLSLEVFTCVARQQRS